MIGFWWPVLIASRLFAADFDAIRAEPNLERRSQMALQQADASFALAKKDYAAGEKEKTGRDLNAMQTAVEISRESLRETGKNPRKHTKPFKLAETETRDLLRKLEGLEHAMEFEDRKMIEIPKEKVQEAHDEWLNGIISGQK